MEEIGREEWGRSNKVCVLYEVGDLSLSGLRVVGFLEAIARKMVVFGEFKGRDIVKVIDVRQLKDE